MVADRPTPARHFRDLRTFVVEHRRTVAVDVGVLTGWALLLLALGTLGMLPREVLYVAVFAGVLSYSLVARWREPAPPN